MSTTATPQRLYRLDFAGRHTIATGMVNTALTAVTAAVVAHVATEKGAVTELRAALSIAGVTIVGAMMTLAWGVISQRHDSGKTVAHHLACWIGAGIWAAAVAFREWTVDTLITYGGILLAASVIIGFAAWMSKPDISPEVRAELARRAEEERKYEERDGLAGEWIDRIERVTRLNVKIPAIEDFPMRSQSGHRVGYTLEVHLPTGGCSWETIRAHQKALAADAELGHGCDVSTSMGVTRRIAMIDVTVIDILQEPQPYPEDYGPLSIHDPIPVMTSRSGQVAGPTMREHNTGIFGESGCGKTNTGQVYGAGIARMTDALLCDVDVTGMRLSTPLLRPFLEGRVKKPAVFWAAYDEEEAFLLFRALQRAAIARNNGYGDLKFSMGIDKMPINEDYPGFLVRVDEVKHVVGAAADSRLFPLAKNMVDDHRDAGIRVLFLALRGTNDIMMQGVQAQLHHLGVLKATSKSEYVAVFHGQASEIDPADAPYPGCIQMRIGSAGSVKPYHVWWLDPKQIDEIAVTCAEYQPEVDALTWLALNGRAANGEPFDDLLPDELDCCATRWDRLRDKMGITIPGHQYGEGTKTVPAGKKSSDDSIAAAQAGIAEAVARARQTVERQREEREQDAEFADRLSDAMGDEDLDDVIRKILENTPGAASLPPREEGKETVRDRLRQERSEIPQDKWQMVMQIIEAAGPGGIEMSKIWENLVERGVPCVRPTVHGWLKAMTVGAEAPYRDRIEWRPDREGSRNGRWYAITLEQGN